MSASYVSLTMLSEDFAAYILNTAVHERRASELLDTLFAGGSVTVDGATGKLVLITAQQMGLEPQ